MKNAISIDTLIMRIVDIMLCFPSFFLILTVVALLPASIYNIMIVIGLTSWMGTTRFVRAEFLSLREQDFVTAARALGIFKDQRALIPLMTVLTDKVPDVRGGAAEALVEIGIPDTKTFLIAALYQYDDVNIAKIFLNCGDSQLENEARR